MLRLTVVVTLAQLAAAVFDKELHEKYLRMPEHEFIEYFNNQDYSWKITHYDNDIDRRFGALINYNHINDHPVQSHESYLSENLPDNFDSREKWPHCKSISEINDQGDCGSCWTFGTANTASDRTCIHKGINVHLAEQDFECMNNDPVCQGGDPYEAFEFWQSGGLVSQECKPYNISKLNENKCSKDCVNKNIDYTHDKHYAEKVYRVSNESVDSIKTELFNNGPIQAGFVVFDDFMFYKGGIYEHTHGKFRGLHSVRVIGYGVEDNKQYWLVANSWTPKWGEKELFRVKVFAADLAFETYLYTGIPKN